MNLEMFWYSTEMIGESLLDQLCRRLGIAELYLQAGTYRRLAQAVFWFHMLWIVIMLGGIPMCALYPWYKPVHAIVMGATIGSQIIWLGCPLTTLEQLLRKKADPGRHNYTGSFTAAAIRKIFGLSVSSWSVLITLAAAVVVSAIVVLK